MRRFHLGLLLFTAAMSIVWGTNIYAQPRAAKPSPDADRAFRVLSNQFIDDIYFRYNPSRATLAGEHRYDSQLEDFSKPAVDAYLGGLRTFRKRLDEVRADLLSTDEQIDLQVLKNAVERQLFYLEKLHWLEAHPEYYTQILFQSVYPLATDGGIPAEQRMRAITARLSQFPSFITSAEAWITSKHSREVTLLARYNLSALRILLGKGIPEELAGVSDQKLQTEFRASNADAQKAIAGFIDFLGLKDRQVKWNSSYNIRPEALAQLLALDDMLNTPVPELLKIAEDEVSRIDAEMKLVAGKLAPDLPMEETIKIASTYHPSRSQLESAYAQTFANIRQFIKQKSLLDIPDIPSPEVRPTPEWIRSVGTNFPNAITINALPQETGGVPTFFVAFGPTATPAQVELELSRHNFGVLTWRAIHDVFPGQYTEDSVMGRTSRVRSVLGSRVSRQGWNNYAVTMMLDAGFLPPELASKTLEADVLKFKLSLLREQKIRVLVMATALTSQTKDLLYRKSAEYFNQISDGGVEPSQYIKNIVDDPLCFADTLGMLEIRKLKQDYRKAQGQKYSEQMFNNTVLRLSGAPIPLIRKVLLGENSGPSL